MDGREEGRETHRGRNAAGIVPPETAVLAQDSAQKAPAGLRRAETAGHGLIHPAGAKIGQVWFRAIQNSDHGIAGADDLPGRMAKTVQQVLGIAFRTQLQPKVYQGSLAFVDHSQLGYFLGKLVGQ